MKAKIGGLLATAVSLTALDILWLAVLARDLYQKQIGHLLGPEPYLPAAAAFYVLYLVSVWWVAVLPSRTVGQGVTRGAALGFFGYGVYELTNRAMLRDWPTALIPIDWTWGIFLTGTCAAAGTWVQSRLKS
ncbi:MAG: DUF2177 family protein [Candidatus Eremiobacteraeota bacterium]|nr:DUF2177 family protein [Candidatus Eremiobacteraeota bacterium]MCW5872593.1 DUF2177 family protein [Candidatus Eremiobacteraeota bacterium]